MSDDQDGCEWVNVSSGTGQRPLNGCVCVYGCCCHTICVLWLITAVCLYI